MLEPFVIQKVRGNTGVTGIIKVNSLNSCAVIADNREEVGRRALYWLSHMSKTSSIRGIYIPWNCADFTEAKLSADSGFSCKRPANKWPPQPPFEWRNSEIICNVGSHDIDATGMLASVYKTWCQQKWGWALKNEERERAAVMPREKKAGSSWGEEIKGRHCRLILVQEIRGAPRTVEAERWKML